MYKAFAGLALVIAILALFYGLRNDKDPEDYKYLELLDWPPQVQSLSQPYSCTEAGDETARAGETDEREIDGRTFCVTTIVEGAAGSVYTQYAYATGNEGKTMTATWSVRMPQCANYNEAEQRDCEDEQEVFDPDELMDDFFEDL